MERFELQGFMFFDTYLETGKRLDDRQFRLYIEALMQYSKDLTEPDFSDDALLETCFNACKGSIRASRNKYLEKINRLRKCYERERGYNTDDDYKNIYELK